MRDTELVLDKMARILNSSFRYIDYIQQMVTLGSLAIIICTACSSTLNKLARSFAYGI